MVCKWCSCHIIDPGFSKKKQANKTTPLNQPKAKKWVFKICVKKKGERQEKRTNQSNKKTRLFEEKLKSFAGETEPKDLFSQMFGLCWPTCSMRNLTGNLCNI